LGSTCPDQEHEYFDPRLTDLDGCLIALTLQALSLSHLDLLDELQPPIPNLLHPGFGSTFQFSFRDRTLVRSPVVNTDLPLPPRPPDRIRAESVSRLVLFFH
jgi:hypothetical protein